MVFWGTPLCFRNLQDLAHHAHGPLPTMLVDECESYIDSLAKKAVGRVAPGDCSPGAPTDPYVPALEHTAPHIMGSLREHRLNELHVSVEEGNAPAVD